MEYFFILGRNPTLSYAEILSYLKSHGIAYSVVFFKKNFLVMSVGEGIKLNIQEFGGVMKIGKANIFDSEKNLDVFVKDYFMDLGKFSFSVLGDNSEEYTEEMEQKLMKKFRSEKIKAQVRHSRASMKLQEGDEVTIPNSDVEFFYQVEENKIYFGRVDQEYSYEEIKKRDMKKPARRNELAISPRLAKILINLSQVREGQLLVDPFCGIGVIVQEALLKGINCFGVDKDRFAITGAKKNIDWLSDNFEISGRARFHVGDSANIPSVKIDGVATEPALGDLVKKRLFDKVAPRYIQDFEKMIIPILKRIKELKTPGSKVVLTMPCIRQFSVSMIKIANFTGLKVYQLDDVQMPIKEFREKQHIGREIVVLE
jgi:tRNA G10  N-methylase Trm11